MQNSLFTLNPVTDSDRVTGSDVVFGKTYGKLPHKRINEKPVTTCHSVTNRAEALLLKANLERRGVLLLAKNGVIICDGSSAVIDRFAMDIVRLKPALIQLLNTPAVAATPAATAIPDDLPMDATTAAAAMAPGDGAPDDPRVKLVLSGQTVVAHRRSTDDAKAKINRDNDLIEWAEARGLAVGIMREFRNPKWGNKKWKNTFPMKKALNGSDRDEVCDKFAAKLAKSPEKVAQIGELKGKVLVCCCYPERCHGDELARRANELPDVAAADGSDGAPDVSAMAPDVLPQLTPDECAALLARYRAGGAILTLEMVEHAGAQSLALGIELTSGVQPEKRARAFMKITRDGLALVRALELEGAPIIEGGAAALLYAPDDLALGTPQLT